MRLVHLTTEFPWPATSGGPMRTLSQLRVLASLSEVTSITLVSVAEHRIASHRTRELENAIPKVHVVPPVFHPVHLFDFKRYVPRTVALRLLGVPYLAGKWHSPKLKNTLRQTLLRNNVDAAYIDHLGMAVYLPVIQSERPRCRTVLDEHNVESDFFKEFAAKKTGALKLLAEAELHAAQSFERRMLQKVDSVVAISTEDARAFERLAGTRAHVVPVVMPFERRTRPPPGRPHFCFVGNLRWQPNVRGLEWLCQDVWPRVRRRLPGATLEIAGVGLELGARDELRVPEAWCVDGVTTVGFLDELEPLYARSLGMLAPVVGGSGVRLKVLEGFRAGMPLVTTKDGAAGLAIHDGQEALVASDPESFADRVHALATDASLRERLRQGGYAYLEKHHSLPVAATAMRAALGLA